MRPIFIQNVIASAHLPTVMQNIGLAVLAIFIPIAISLLEQSDDQDYRVLDKAVKQDHILGAKTFLWKVGLIFVPMLLWDIDSVFLKFLVFALWGTGVYLVLATLIKAYHWIREGRTEHRLAYLASRNDGKDLPDLWKSVWEATGKEPQADEKYFKLFASLIGKLIAPANLQASNIILVDQITRDAHPFFLKRAIMYLTSRDDAFSKILDWHFWAWSAEYKHLVEKDTSDSWIGLRQLSAVLDDILKLVTERSLKERYSFGFFELLDKHIKRHQKEFIHGDKHDYYYLESFFQVFYPVFFANIHESDERFDIWSHYFPKEWLVTKASLDDKENISARGTMISFFRWAEDRIRLTDKKEWDGALEDAAKEIFPTTDPMVWAVILTFAMRPWSNNQRIKNLIEHPMSFGLVSRIRTFWGEYDEHKEALIQEGEQELQATIELAIKIFPGTFKEDSLNDWVKELEVLSYSEESREESRRKYVLDIFKRTLSFRVQLEKKAS